MRSINSFQYGDLRSVKNIYIITSCQCLGPVMTYTLHDWTHKKWLLELIIPMPEYLYWYEKVYLNYPWIVGLIYHSSIFCNEWWKFELFSTSSKLVLTRRCLVRTSLLWYQNIERSSRITNAFSCAWKLKSDEATTEKPLYYKSSN